MIRFIPFAFIIMLMSCASSRPSTAQQKVDATIQNNQKSIILTIILKASWNADSTVKFETYNDIRNEGIAKRNPRVPYDAAFVVYFTDASGNKKDSAYINHPLQERIETENHNDAKLNTKLFKKEEGFTDVRINFKPEMKQMIIKDLLTNQSQTLNIK